MDEQKQNNVSQDRESPVGPTILGGRYRLLHLLHRRPRVDLYLGQRLVALRGEEARMSMAGELVAIRVLNLAGLELEVRRQVEQAALEEFVAPGILGSPRLPGAGDRARREGERHYLVMQLRGMQVERETMPLDELLLNKKQWPVWLDVETALNWGVQLCRIVARLQRLGVVLGDLDPSTILVDPAGPADWSPVLLVSWPPAPRFWPGWLERKDVYRQVFPAPRITPEHTFAAPEMLRGACDERSDVYSLGAILYLLFTCYAPVTALRRQQAVSRDPLSASLSLVSPRLFNRHITPVLEQVLLRALALDPADRYPTAFSLAEALEGIAAQSEPIPDKKRR